MYYTNHICATIDWLQCTVCRQHSTNSHEPNTTEISIFKQWWCKLNVLYYNYVHTIYTTYPLYTLIQISLLYCVSWIWMWCFHCLPNLFFKIPGLQTSLHNVCDPNSPFSTYVYPYRSGAREHTRELMSTTPTQPRVTPIITSYEINWSTTTNIRLTEAN